MVKKFNLQQCLNGKILFMYFCFALSACKSGGGDSASTGDSTKTSSNTPVPSNEQEISKDDPNIGLSSNMNQYTPGVCAGPVILTTANLTASTLATLSGDLAAYSDTSCNTPLTSVQLSAGSSSKKLYIKSSSISHSSSTLLLKATTSLGDAKLHLPVVENFDLISLNPPKLTNFTVKSLSGGSLLSSGLDSDDGILMSSVSYYASSIVPCWQSALTYMGDFDFGGTTNGSFEIEFTLLELTQLSQEEMPGASAANIQFGANLNGRAVTIWVAHQGIGYKDQNGNVNFIENTANLVNNSRTKLRFVFESDAVLVYWNGNLLDTPVDISTNQGISFGSDQHSFLIATRSAGFSTNTGLPSSCQQKKARLHVHRLSGSSTPIRIH